MIVGSNSPKHGMLDMEKTSFIITKSMHTYKIMNNKYSPLIEQKNNNTTTQNSLFCVIDIEAGISII